MKPKISHRQRKIRTKAIKRMHKACRPIESPDPTLEIVATALDYGTQFGVAMQDDTGWRGGIRMTMGKKWKHAEQAREYMIERLLSVANK